MRQHFTWLEYLSYWENECANYFYSQNLLWFYDDHVNLSIDDIQLI